MRTPLPTPPAERRGLATPTSAPTLRLALLVLLMAGFAQAAAPTSNADPKLRYWRDQYGDFALIGNTLAQDCRPTTPPPLIGRMPPIDFVPGEGSCAQRDASPDFFWTLDDWTLENTGASTRPYVLPGGSTIAAIAPKLARSQAVLKLPSGARVTYARLYWAATRFNDSAGDKIAAPDLTATFSRPGVVGFETSLTADDYAFQYSAGAEYQYQATADVTNIVKGFGPGAYQVSDVLAVPLDSVNGEFFFDAWWMVVFYEVPGVTPLRHLMLFDAMRLVEGSGSSGTGVFLDGFYVPSFAVNARLGVVAFEGEDPSPDTGDTLSFNGVPLSNDLNPAHNFFNSTRSWTNRNTGVTTDTPLEGVSPGSDGVLDSLPLSNRYDRPQLTGTPGSMSGMDLDVVDVTVAAGDRSAHVQVNTNGDRFWLGGFIISIATQAPDFTNTIQSARNLSRSDGTVRPGDIIEYTISTINVGDDHSRDTVLTDPLPAQLDYVPGSLQLLTVAASDTLAPGLLTDAKGDDVGEYDTATHTLTLYLGTGATPTRGGILRGIVGEGEVGESTNISFLMQVKATTVGKVDNQAFITAGGLLGIAPVTTPSRSPAGSGPTSISVSLSPPPTINAPLPSAYVNTQWPAYEGIAGKGDTVIVSRNDKQVCSVKADALSGAWSCVSTQALEDGGPYVVTVRSEWASGNSSLPTSRLFYVDTVAPTLSISSPVQDGLVGTARPLLSGTAEAYATVTLVLDDRTYGPLDVGLDGTWSFTVPESLPDGLHSLTVTAIDRAGNSSSTSRSWSQDTQPPAVPVIREPREGTQLFTHTPSFSGTTEPESTVRLFLDGIEVGTARAGEDGSWRMESPTRLELGPHRAWALADDAVGNTSGPSSEVPFITSRGSPYGPGCAASPSATACWPWALVLLGLPLRRRSSR